MLSFLQYFLQNFGEEIVKKTMLCYCQALSISLSLNLSLSLRDRDRADTIITFHHHHQHLFVGDLYSSVIHHWNPQAYLIYALKT